MYHTQVILEIDEFEHLWSNYWSSRNHEAARQHRMIEALEARSARSDARQPLHTLIIRMNPCDYVREGVFVRAPLVKKDLVPLAWDLIQAKLELLSAEPTAQTKIIYINYSTQDNQLLTYQRALRTKWRALAEEMQAKSEFYFLGNGES